MDESGALEIQYPEEVYGVVLELWGGYSMSASSSSKFTIKG